MTQALFQDDRIVRETGLEARVANVVGPAADGLGYRLVRIRISNRDGLTVQVMAERPDGTMAIEDCEALSRHLSPVLDVADLIDRAYHLELSSPGIDRPLVRVVDFEHATGHVAKIELARALDGRKRFRGTIVSVADGALTLREAGGDGEADVDVTLPFADMSEARLVLTDAIVAQALRAEKQAKKERARVRKLERANGP